MLSGLEREFAYLQKAQALTNVENDILSCLGQAQKLDMELTTMEETSVRNYFIYFKVCINSTY